MPAEAWRALQASRFPQLTLDCGNSTNPGIVDGPDLRDWSGKATTADQQRIENYISRFDLRDKRILHIGIGNSGLGRRFHRRAKEIVGTSIDAPELGLARSLSLSNYTVVDHNKYSGEHDRIPGRFEFIVDNNPTSPCCCVTHLAELFSFFDSKLAHGGQIVTDREGLAWIPDSANPRWRFDFDDLAAAAAAAGFSTHRVNRDIFVLAREQVPKPGLVSLLSGSLRQSKLIPPRLMTALRRAAVLAVKAPLRAGRAFWSAPGNNAPE
jgi:hypothetical protein